MTLLMYLSNPNRFRLNYVIDGQRTQGASVLPLPGAIASGEYVEFVQATPEYPSISSKLLRIHAAVAEVLPMVGAGEAIDALLRDWDNIQV